MTEPSLDVLAQRLDRMERRLRRWIFGSLALTILAAGVVLNLVLLLGNPLQRETQAENEDTERESKSRSGPGHSFSWTRTGRHGLGLP